LQKRCISSRIGDLPKNNSRFRNLIEKKDLKCILFFDPINFILLKKLQYLEFIDFAKRIIV